MRLWREKGIGNKILRIVRIRHTAAEIWRESADCLRTGKESEERNT